VQEGGGGLTVNLLSTLREVGEVLLEQEGREGGGGENKEGGRGREGDLSAIMLSDSSRLDSVRFLLWIWSDISSTACRRVCVCEGRGMGRGDERRPAR
jgi:hypothetical protein